MPTSYVGNPVATQSPSVQPGPGSVPTASLPADGDTRNAASVAQPWKMVTDFVTWLCDPAGISNTWEQRIWGVRNYRGQRKWFLDHLGHPSGRIVKWNEDWPTDAINILTTSTSAPFTALSTRAWMASILLTTGAAEVRCNLPGVGGVTPALSNNLSLKCGTTVGDLAKLQRNIMHVFAADIAMAFEFDVWPGTSGISETNLFFGMGDQQPTAGLIGGLFYTDGTTNWKCVCGNGSTLSAAVDTGVAVGTTAWHKLRVEWWGANVADDSANAMRFYINGVKKAEITTSLPTGINASQVLGVRKISGSAQMTGTFVSPIQFTASY